MTDLSKVDLESPSVAELEALATRIAEEIAKKRSRIDDELAAIAKREGLSVENLMKHGRGKRTGNGKVYRNPANPKQEWSGKGRKPKWYTEALDGGASVESLEIARTESIGLGRGTTEVGPLSESTN